MSNESLTVKYIEEHRNQIHTYDSFGRAIAALILQSAKLQMANNTLTGDNVKFKADIKVFPITTMGCLGVEVCVPLAGCTRVHVNVD